jgi:hypothetical protein
MATAVGIEYELRHAPMGRALLVGGRPRRSGAAAAEVQAGDPAPKTRGPRLADSSRDRSRAAPRRRRRGAAAADVKAAAERRGCGRRKVQDKWSKTTTPPLQAHRAGEGHPSAIAGRLPGHHAQNSSRRSRRGSSIENGFLSFD